MISTKYKFIYIHIPRTGGNSIQAALEPYADDELRFRKSVGNVVNDDSLQGLDVFNMRLGFNTPDHKHATINDYYSKLGDEIYSYYIFTSIRNPWDRVISQTAFLTPGGLSTSKLSISEFCFPNSMMSYLSINGKILINDVIRFEYLTDDFSRICKKLNIACNHIEHKNQSIRSIYTDYYTPETRDAVQNRFVCDIEQFKYSFEGGSC